MVEINIERGDFTAAHRYYGQFRQWSPRQTPRSLELGIRLARVYDDQDAEASYALVLKSMYPTSKQYLDYREKK